VPPTSAREPVWTEAAWPFPIDQWGQGWAYQCKASDCGVDVNLYLRPKIGFCNCQTGVADDGEKRRGVVDAGQEKPGAARFAVFQINAEVTRGFANPWVREE
jgi:hypothetical protein